MFRLLVIAGCVWIAAPQLQAAEPLSSVMAMEEAAADISVGGVSVAQTGTDGNGCRQAEKRKKTIRNWRPCKNKCMKAGENRLNAAW